MGTLGAAVQQRARERGFRMTLQRQIILDAIESMEGHITAEGVYARIRSRFPPLLQLYRPAPKGRSFFCTA